MSPLPSVSVAVGREQPGDVEHDSPDHDEGTRDADPAPGRLAPARPAFTPPTTDPNADAVTVLLASTLSTRNRAFVSRHGRRSGGTPPGLEGRRPVRAQQHDMASVRLHSQVAAP
jgi:hypothetical protein